MGIHTYCYVYYVNQGGGIPLQLVLPGGPLREFFHLLLSEIAQNNTCFVGKQWHVFQSTTW